MSKIELNLNPEISREIQGLQKLDEIASFLTENKFLWPSAPGITQGKAGVALFLYYYAKYREDQEAYYGLCGEMLQYAFADVINDKNHGLLHYTEISELGIMINYLQDEAFLDNSFDEILEKIDIECIEGARLFTEQKNFDRFAGFLTIGDYFLGRLTSKNCRKSLFSLIDCLLDNQHSVPEGIYWESQLFNKQLIYLGWSHGSASVILFLIKFNEKQTGYREKEINICLKKACNYLLSHKHERIDSFFPDIVGEESTNSPLNLCYGDLGINYAILTCGKSLKDSHLYNTGMEGLLQSAQRKSLSTCKIHDASFIYGASGLMVFFKKINTDHPDQHFSDAASYWHSIALSLTNHDNRPGGYSSHFNQGGSQIKTSLFEGISGFGLSLIAYNSGSEDLLYLTGY